MRGTVDDWLHIGGIRSVNPGRREIRVAAQPAHEHEFDVLEWVRVAPRQGAVIRCRVVSAAPAGALFRITLAPGVPRDTVAAMKGGAVVIDPQERRPRPDGAWRVQELIGLEVFAQDATLVGTVAEVIEAPANDAAVIEKAGGGRMTIPLIEPVIEEIDLDGGAMVVKDLAPYAVDDG